MLRNVVFVTEKRSHASKLQNTLGSVHDGDLVLRHQFFATMSSDEFKNGQKNTPSRREGVLYITFSQKLKRSAVLLKIAIVARIIRAEQDIFPQEY